MNSPQRPPSAKLLFTDPEDEHLADAFEMESLTLGVRYSVSDLEARISGVRIYRSKQSSPNTQHRRLEPVIVSASSSGRSSSRASHIFRKPHTLSATGGNASDSDSDEVAEPLWRRSKDPSPLDEPAWRSAAKPGDLPALNFEDLDAVEVQKEAKRLATKQAVDRISNASYKELFLDKEEQDLDSEGKMSLKDAVDKILVADFFLITLGLIWFLTGVLQQSITKDATLLDGWMQLWTTLFQPAIGIFMAAAGISAFSSWLAKRE